MTIFPTGTVQERDGKSAEDPFRQDSREAERPLHNICFCLCEEAAADEAIL
jgi:hypothetical protein